MLVEDDKSLREIYGVRLLAEGYDIVSAGDGEEALAMAIKERPALIVSDVMMPRISGFDMLDILRSTTETKTIKVIMMTALSSEDQRKHGEQLGADRYLVKSQVGIEDVVRVVHEVLGDMPAAAAATPPPPSSPMAAPTLPAQQTPTAAQPMRQTVAAQPRTIDPMMRFATPAPQPAAAQPMQAPIPPVSSTMPSAPSTRQRIIQPINDPTKKIDINGLLDKELAREAGIDENNRPTIATTQQEKSIIANQLQASMPQPTAAPKTVPITVPVQQQPAQAQTYQSIPVQQAPPAAAMQTAQRPPIQPPQRPNAVPVVQRPNSAPPAPTV